MTSLLDDAKRMLEIQYGDIPRLEIIKKTLEQNKMLNVADRKYLCRLTQEKPEKPLQKTRKNNFEKASNFSEGDMDIDELEEKIRVETEPS